MNPTDIHTRLTSALAGHYRLERELGAGGMATVYLAEDERHHRRVAIKVLASCRSPTPYGSRRTWPVRSTTRTNAASCIVM